MAETPQRVAAIKQGSPAGDEGDRRLRGGDFDRARDYEGVADGLLIDAKPPKDAVLPGATAGRSTGAWRAASPQVPWLLSGGLDADNVGAAIALSGALGVDVSSASNARRASRTKRRLRPSPPRARRLRAAIRARSRVTKIDKPNSFRNGPDERGHFGIFGGRSSPRR